MLKSPTRNLLARTAIGAALIALVGCSSDNSSSDNQPGSPSGSGGASSNGGSNNGGASNGGASNGGSSNGGSGGGSNHGGSSNNGGASNGGSGGGGAGQSGGSGEDAAVGGFHDAGTDNANQPLADAGADTSSTKPIDASVDSSDAAIDTNVADIKCEASTCSGAATHCASSTTLETCAVDSNGCPYLVSSDLCTTNVANAYATCTGTSCGFACNTNYVPDQGACVPPASRPISPLSGTFVGTRLPTLKWKLPTGFTDAHVDVCADRACTTVLFSKDVTGTQTTVTSELPQGIVHWRVVTKGGSTQSTLSSPVWEIELGGKVGVHNAPLTTGWGSVPDFNGDGFADFIGQTRGVGSNSTKVYPGGASALGTVLTLTAGNSGPGLNNPQLIGDFNGDGFSDLAIANGDLGIYQGSANGLPGSANQTITLPGGETNTMATGDIDGDGYADLFYPSQTAPDINSNSYIALNVFYGGPSGLSVSVTTTTTAVLAHLSSSNGCDLGDVNGDGYADALVVNQAPPGPPGTTASGLVFYGSASGLGTTPTTLAAVSGPGGNAALIASAGDVNGDGYIDVLLGAGSLRVFHGGSNGISTTSSATISSGILNNGIFPSVVPALGDINGDGYADVVVPGTTSPYVSIYTGSSAGLVSGSPVSFAPVPPTGYVLADGASSPVNPVGGAGDTNGDGYPDFGLSAQWQNVTSGNNYQTYVFHGGSPIPTVVSTALSLGWVSAVR